MEEQSQTSNDNIKLLVWSDYLENLLAKWGDDALSYAWLHTKSESKYRKLNYYFIIPIVILSTLTGTVNVGMSSIFPPEYVHYGQLSIGAIGIFTGILGTLQNFFKYAQSSESHRYAATQWYKFYRNLKTELALDRVCRKNASEFFVSSKNEMDRLLDSSPLIPNDMVEKYKKHKNINNDENLQNNNIQLPDIIGNLKKTFVYNENNKSIIKNIEDIEDIENEENEEKISNMIKNDPHFGEIKNYMKEIEEFKKSYDPIKNEIDMIKKDLLENKDKVLINIKVDGEEDIKED